MRQQAQQQGAGAGGGASFAEVAAFLAEERGHMRAALEAKDAVLEAKDAAIEQHRKEQRELAEARATPAPEVVSGAQLAALQARLEGLHNFITRTSHDENFTMSGTGYGDSGAAGAARGAA